jgi:hypothetical protein
MERIRSVVLHDTWWTLPVQNNALSCFCSSPQHLLSDTNLRIAKLQRLYNAHLNLTERFPI